LDRQAYLQVKTAASAETKAFLVTLFRNGANREETAEFIRSVEFFRMLKPNDLGDIKEVEITNVLEAFLALDLNPEEVGNWLPLFALFIGTKTQGFEKIGTKIQQKIDRFSQDQMLTVKSNLDEKVASILRSLPYTKMLFA
jgi:hypothetical protein